MSVLIDEYKRAEEARLEAERQRIRAEEERKAREAAERAAEEERKRIRAEEEEKAKAEAKLHAAQLDDAKPGIVPQTPAASISRQEAEKKTRPSDDEIINALALHFRVHESVVFGWLVEMDLDAASRRIELIKEAA